MVEVMSVITVIFTIIALLIFLTAILMSIMDFTRSRRKMPENPDLVLNGMAKYTGGYLLISKEREENGKHNRKIIIGKPADVKTDISPFAKPKMIEIPVSENNIFRYSSGMGSNIRNIIVIHPPTYAGLPELFKKFPNYELALEKTLTKVLNPLMKAIKNIEANGNEQLQKIKKESEIFKENIVNIKNSMIDGNVFYNNMREIEKSRSEVAIRTFGEDLAKREMIDMTMVSGIKGAAINTFKTYSGEAQEILSKDRIKKKEEI